VVEREERMLTDRNEQPKPQTVKKHPDEWQSDLNPNHMAGQNIGTTDPLAASTAFHLRKRGFTLRGLDDDELKQVPLVEPGSRLQQGATYANLAGDDPREFKASGDVIASGEDAYAPKDRVPYEIWNRLIGAPKPGQE
jgi:hypothetical protein